MESELREGYKMTELGALPEEWEVEKLGHIFKINKESCLPYTTPENYFIHHSIPSFDETGGPIIQLGKEIESNKFLIEYSCILVSKLNPRKPRVNVVKYDDGKLSQCASTEFIVYLPKSIHTDLNYYGYYMFSEFFHTRLQQLATGTTNSHVRVHPSETLKWVIPEPPLPEQCRIATILSTLDETVEYTEALIEKCKNIKAGLMSDLLTRGIDEEGRIRSEGTHRFKDSALGRVPEEWEFGGFEDMVDKSNKNAIKPGPFGSSLKKEFYVGDGYRVYGQEQVIAGTLSIGDYYVNKHKFEELKSFQIDMDDVLISLVGTTGKVLVVPSKFEPGIINPRLLKITPDKRKSNSNFISYLLISSIVTNQLATLSHGGTMDVLNGTTIRKLRFGIPPLQEQHRIAEILAAADQRIEKEEAYRDKLLQLKKGLMQDLLTGKVRVKDGSFQMLEQSEN